MTPQTSPLTASAAREIAERAIETAIGLGYRASMLQAVHAGAAAVPRGEPLTESEVAALWDATPTNSGSKPSYAMMCDQDRILGFAKAIAARVGGGDGKPLKDALALHATLTARAEEAEAKLAEWGEPFAGAHPNDVLRQLHARITEQEARAESAERALAEADKKGWRMALSWAAEYVLNGRDAEGIRQYRDVYYPKPPAPEPPGVVLSDGSVVTRNDGWFCRTLPDGAGNHRSPRFAAIMLDRDTGADFDALKAFAATVGAP